MILSVIILLFGIASHPIDAAVHSAIESLIESRTHAAHEIEYRSVPRELVKLEPAASMRIIDEPRSQYRGLFSLPVEIISRTGARSVYRLGLRVRTFETVAVALTMIDRHQPLDTTQFALQHIETTQCSGEPITSSTASALQGMRSTQIIGAGKMLTRSMIEPLPLIRSGSAVTVRVVRDNVRLSVTGRARADGWKGSVIAVDVDGGGKRQVRARVVDRANVEIAEH